MKYYSAWQKTRKDKWKLRVCIVMFYAKLWLFFLFGRHFNHKIPDTDHFSYSLFINLIISLVPVANFGQISHFKVSYLQPVPSLIFILLLFFIRLFFIYLHIYYLSSYAGAGHCRTVDLLPFVHITVCGFYSKWT